MLFRSGQGRITAQYYGCHGCCAGLGHPGTRDGVNTLSFFVSEFKEDNGIMDNSVIVSLRDIVVEFDGQRILDGLNLDIHDKEFVTLLGSSGCPIVWHKYDTPQGS